MMANTQYYDLLVYDGNTLIGAFVNDNWTKIDTALHAHDTSLSNKKDKQTAVSDPTASGDSVTFIATLSQNAQGVISLTKKTVKTMTGATSSADGAAGLVPKPFKADRDKFLAGDGTYKSQTTYGIATSSALGLIKIGYSENGRNYAVKLSDGKAYVTIPLPNEATTSAAGLMSASDKSKLNGITAGAQPNPGVATTSAAGLMSAADKTKLNGITAGAQPNPGVATTSANGLMSKTDKSKLDGIATGAQKNPGVATTSANGLMSSTDKTKLDGIATGAQKNPGNATTSTAGLMSAADKTKLDGITAGAQPNPGAATTSSAGLMSAADKTKLNGIEAGAQANPGVATTSANGLMSKTDKTKLNGIDTGAQVNRGIKYKHYEMSSKYTIQPGATVSINASWLGYEAISGYVPAALRYFNTGSSNVFAQAVDLSNFGANDTIMILRNVGSAAVQAKASFGVMWVEA